MKDLEKIKEGYEFLLIKNQSKLDGLKAMKPLKLKHLDIEGSKKYMKTLEFYIKFSILVQELTERYSLYQDVANRIISSIDSSGEVAEEDLNDLRKLTQIED
jgi:hypothetical protein